MEKLLDYLDKSKFAPIMQQSPLPLQEGVEMIKTIMLRIESDGPFATPGDQAAVQKIITKILVTPPEFLPSYNNNALEKPSRWEQVCYLAIKKYGPTATRIRNQGKRQQHKE